MTSVTPYVVRGAFPNSNLDYSCLVRIETDTGFVGWDEGRKESTVNVIDAILMVGEWANDTLIKMKHPC